MVSELLQQSLQAHERAKALRKKGDKAEAKEALREARDLRLQALWQDEGRTDPAWADEQIKTPTNEDTHTALMRFYDEQLGPR